MSEGPPEIPQEPASPAERDPASYEKALDVVLALRSAGIVDPLDDENPMVQSALEVVDEWEGQCGLAARGIDNVEKAHNMVKASLLFLTAGYTETQFIRQALERLNGEYADVLREEGNDEIRNILGDAIEALDQKLAQGNPKEMVAHVIEACIDEAKQKVQSGDPKEVVDAIRLLTSTLLHPDYKRYFSKFPKKREFILKLRVAVQNIKAGGDPAQIDIVEEE